MSRQKFADYQIVDLWSVPPARAFSKDWLLPDMAAVIFEDANQNFPGVWIEMRCEPSGGGLWKPLMNQIRIPAYARMNEVDNDWGFMTPSEDVPDVAAQDLRDVAVYIPKLFRHVVMASAASETWFWGEKPTNKEVMQMGFEDLQRLTSGGLIRPRRGKAGWQIEDDALRQWEREYRPKGYSQKSAADEMGIAYSTFRSYLSRARSRRDSKSAARGKKR